MNKSNDQLMSSFLMFSILRNRELFIIKNITEVIKLRDMARVLTVFCSYAYTIPQRKLRSVISNVLLKTKLIHIYIPDLKTF